MPVRRKQRRQEATQKGPLMSLGDDALNGVLVRVPLSSLGAAAATCRRASRLISRVEFRELRHSTRCAEAGIVAFVTRRTGVWDGWSITSQSCLPHATKLAGLKDEWSTFCSLDHELFLVGGADETLVRATTRVRVYDGILDEWHDMPKMIEPRCRPLCTFLADELVAVGSRGERKSYSCEIFDPDAQTWSRLPDLVSPDDSPGVAVVDACFSANVVHSAAGLLLCVLGISLDVPPFVGMPCLVTQYYATNEWRARYCWLPFPDFPVDGSDAATCDDKIVIYFVEINHLMVYDPVVNAPLANIVHPSPRPSWTLGARPQLWLLDDPNDPRRLWLFDADFSRPSCSSFDGRSWSEWRDLPSAQVWGRTYAYEREGMEETCAKRAARGLYFQPFFRVASLVLG